MKEPDKSLDGATADHWASIEAWIEQGMQNYRQSPQTTVAHARRYLEQTEREEQNLLSARLYLLIGRCSDSLNDPILGLECSNRALNLLEFLPQDEVKPYMALAYMQLALGHTHTGNSRLAIELLLDALKIAEEVDHGFYQTKILINLAYVCEKEGQRERGIEYCRKGIEVLERHPSRETEAEICNNLAWYLADTRPDEAFELIERCLALSDPEKELILWANAIDTKAEILAALNRDEEALPLYLESARCQGIRGHALYRIHTLIRAARCLKRMGRYDEALKTLEGAMEESLAEERPPALDELHFELAMMLVHHGDAAKAANHFLEAYNKKDEIAKAHFKQSLQAIEAKQQMDWSFREADLLKEKNEELENAIARAEEANQLKSQFLANMSHEIRTPMNGVIGITELLRMTDLNDEQRSYVDTIQSSGQSLLVILNDILDLSKIEAGRLELEQDPINMTALVEDVRQLFECQASQKGVELRCVLPQQTCIVKGDGVRIRQIVANLVSNAVKFTAKGCVEVGITIPETGVDIYIRDTGIGIPSEGHERIFESFTQADGSTTRTFGGTGLGLTIAQKLAQRMGGGIKVESKVGVGSTFRVHLGLPLVDAESIGVQPVSPSQSPNTRVLLTEDHPVNGLVISKQLQRLGCDVIHVDNGQKAVDILAEEEFDLIFMDVQMPVLDGYGATKALREAGIRTPIIGLTANAMPEHRAACLESGMDDYMSKPVRLQDLGEMISKWTGLALQMAA